MNDEVMVEVIELDGKEFFQVDSISNYSFFAEVSNPENICVLKEETQDGDVVLVSLEEDEIDKAFSLYYEKYGNSNN